MRKRTERLLLSTDARLRDVVKQQHQPSLFGAIATQMN